MSTTLADLRLAMRGLRRNPLFALDNLVTFQLSPSLSGYGDERGSSATRCSSGFAPRPA